MVNALVWSERRRWQARTADERDLFNEVWRVHRLGSWEQLRPRHRAALERIVQWIS